MKALQLTHPSASPDAIQINVVSQSMPICGPTETVVRVLMAVEPVDGGALVLQPSEGADGSIEWTCFSPDIEKKYLPASCRE